MHSMDFEEFLWAKGYDSSVICDMLEHMKTFTPFNNVGYSDQIYTFPYFCAFLLKRFMKTFEPVE